MEICSPGLCRDNAADCQTALAHSRPSCICPPGTTNGNPSLPGIIDTTPGSSETALPPRTGPPPNHTDSPIYPGLELLPPPLYLYILQICLFCLCLSIYMSL